MGAVGGLENIDGIDSGYAGLSSNGKKLALSFKQRVQPLFSLLEFYKPRIGTPYTAAEEAVRGYYKGIAAARCSEAVKGNSNLDENINPYQDFLLASRALCFVEYKDVLDSLDSNHQAGLAIMLYEVGKVRDALWVDGHLDSNLHNPADIDEKIKDKKLEVINSLPRHFGSSIDISVIISSLADLKDVYGSE